MTTSENQVRHLYVLTTVDSSDSITLESAPNGCYYFNIANAKGAEYALRSDLIDPKKILYVKGTAAEKMARALTVKTITVPNITAATDKGDEYYVRVTFRQYWGQTDSDTYVKYANATVTSTDTTNGVAAKLRDLLAASLGKDACKLLSVSGTGANIVLTEVEQPWRKGIIESLPVYFDVTLTKVSGSEVTEIAATTSSGSTINNGKKTADLEYFLMGERGDQYRGVGFPNNFETDYLVDPSEAYDYIDIHYYTDEGGTNNDWSEKTITIVGTLNDDGGSNLSSLASDIADDLGFDVSSDLSQDAQ